MLIQFKEWTQGKNMPGCVSSDLTSVQKVMCYILDCVFVCVCAQSCLILCNPTDYSLPSSSVHGISQARTLEWVAISSSRGSSQPKDQTHISCIFCIGRQILCHWAIWDPLRMWTMYRLVTFSWDKYFFSAQLLIQVVIPNTCEQMCSALLMLIKTTNLSPSVLIRGWK